MPTVNTGTFRARGYSTSQHGLRAVNGDAGSFPRAAHIALAKPVSSITAAKELFITNVVSEGDAESVNEFLWNVRVYYEDTDAGGVVYYANYLRFLERARTEWLRSLGFEQDEMIARDGLLFAVRAVQIDYLKPARFNELLQVSAHVLHSGKASLSIAQSVRRPADGLTLCTATVKLACLDATSLRPKPMPGKLLACLDETGLSP